MTRVQLNADRRVLVAIFVLFAALYVVTGFGKIESFDGEMMFRVTESLVERQSLVIHDEIFHSNEPYSVYGLGTSVFALPFYIGGRLFNIDPRWFVSLFNPIVTAFTMVLVYLLARRLAIAPRVSVSITLAYGLGSLAWPYTKTFFSEPLTTLLLVLAVLAAVEFRQSRDARWLLVLGGSLGAGVLTREDTLLVVPVIIAYAFWPHGSLTPHVRSMVFFIVPFVLFGVVTWWYHDLRFHSLLSGYVIKTGNAFDWSPGTFATGFYGLLISSGKGIIFYTPLVLAAPFSWRRFWRANSHACALFSFLIVERFVFFSFLLRWWGGVSWGPRYVVPLIPFILLPIGLLLDLKDGRTMLRRAAISALFAVSVLAQLPGVSISYAAYWNATINTKVIIADQIFFSPRWSPLFGQFQWMIRGTNVDWLLTWPSPSIQWPMRALLVLCGVLAAVVLCRFLGSNAPWQSPEPTITKSAKAVATE